MGVVKSNIDVLVKEGLGERAENDFILARDTCLALLKLGPPKKVQGQLQAEPFRFPQNHQMFDRLQTLLINGRQWWWKLFLLKINVYCINIVLWMQIFRFCIQKGHMYSICFAISFLHILN